MKKLIIDQAHSEIGFKVKHLMISTVKGTFGTVMGSAEGELDNLSVNVIVDATTINTNDENRDNHLRGEDFFDVEKYPSIHFEATGVNVNNLAVTGNLTIKNVTREVVFAMIYNGQNTDPWGNIKHGFEISGKINRNDFGLIWNVPLDAGGLLVSENVDIIIDIQAIEDVS